MCRKFGQFITLQDNRLWKLVEWLYAFSRGSGPDSPHQLFRQLPNYFPWNKMAEVGIHFCWTLKKTNKQTKKTWWSMSETQTILLMFSITSWWTNQIELHLLMVWATDARGSNSTLSSQHEQDNQAMKNYHWSKQSNMAQGVTWMLIFLLIGELFSS